MGKCRIIFIILRRGFFKQKVNFHTISITNSLLRYLFSFHTFSKNFKECQFLRYMDTKFLTSAEQKVFQSKSSIASFPILVQTVRFVTFFLFNGYLFWLSNFVWRFSFSHRSRKRNKVKFSKLDQVKFVEDSL